jgi:hypothetical protein
MTTLALGSIHEDSLSFSPYIANLLAGSSNILLTSAVPSPHMLSLLPLGSQPLGVLR